MLINFSFFRRKKNILAEARKNLDDIKTNHSEEDDQLRKTKEELGKMALERDRLKLEVSAARAAACRAEEKYSKLKLKYQEKKRLLKEKKEGSSKDKVQIGEGTFVPATKLALCRTPNLSRYTGDLMELVFGRETLGQSVLKGVKKNNAKNILNPECIKDIISHVVTKYSCGVAEVRSAIRQKLNTCHKSCSK